MNESNIQKKYFFEPVGTVLALLPFDFPILESINCLVPSILCGNACLLKDSTACPTIANHFEKSLEEKAPGLAQKFFIDPLDVQDLYRRKRVNYVAFTGTYEVALDVYYELAQNDFIDCSLDLGGLNHAYVDETCEDKLDKIADACLWGVFYNSGQSRNDIQSILVHESLFNKFTNMLSEKVYETLVLKDPMDETSNFGCIPFPEAIDIMDNMVDDAVKQGATVTIGGFKNTDESGFGRFYEPTLIANVH